MTRRFVAVVGLACAFAASLSGSNDQTPVESFAVFGPALQQSARTIIARLDRNEAGVHMLDADDGDIGVLAAIPVSVDGDRLADWARAIEDLQRGPYVKTVHRLSRPPSLRDFDDLDLDERDLVDLKQCRPGNCGLKMSDAEIAAVRDAIGKAGAGWRAAGLRAFRQVMLGRAQQYLRSGLAGMTYHDKHKMVGLQAVAAEISAGLGFADGQSLTISESFLYWSVEALGGRPIAGITHSTIFRSRDAGHPETMVVGRRVFANHYFDGGLGVTAIIRAGHVRYLVYINRSRLDLISGFWGGVVRQIVERRVREEAPAVIGALKRRLESGEPPRTREADPIHAVFGAGAPARRR